MTVDSLTRLTELQHAVEAADDAWFDALKAGADGKAEKVAHKAAKDAYRAFERDLMESGFTVTCGRCGGDGVVHYGNVVFHTSHGSERTCFECGGAKTVLLRAHKFSAQAPTRFKSHMKWLAEQDAKAANWKAWAAENAEVAAFLVKHKRPDDDYASDNFLTSMYEKVEKWGTLTEKQLDAVKRSMVKDQKETERKALLASSPFPHGKQTVEGEIVSVKSGRGYAGGTVWKALIVLSTGHKVYGTCSEKFYAAADKLGCDVTDLKVKFTASFEQSSDDKGFGFFKSPAGVEVLGQRETV